MECLCPPAEDVKVTHENFFTDIACCSSGYL